MNEYILLMYNDSSDSLAADDNEKWGAYITNLRKSGQFGGGSSIGIGERHRANESPSPANSALTGFIRVRAENLEQARQFLVGNPSYEAGATVEIRELIRE